MLALNLVEQRSGHLRLPVVEPALGFEIERFHVACDIGGIARPTIAARTSGGEQRRPRKGGAKDELAG